VQTKSTAIHWGGSFRRRLGPGFWTFPRNRDRGYASLGRDELKYWWQKKARLNEGRRRELQTPRSSDDSAKMSSAARP